MAVRAGLRVGIAGLCGSFRACVPLLGSIIAVFCGLLRAGAAWLWLTLLLRGAWGGGLRALVAGSGFLLRLRGRGSAGRGFTARLAFSAFRACALWLHIGSGGSG